MRPPPFLVTSAPGIAGKATPAMREQIARGLDPVHRRDVKQRMCDAANLSWALGVVRRGGDAEHVAGLLTNGCRQASPDPKAMQNLRAAREGFQSGQARRQGGSQECARYQAKSTG
jgi:hypothetical protein